MNKTIKNQQGVSLLLGMGFSIAILSTAAMISEALISSQKNTRNIEDINIAFFAAEAGIEEALFYNSFHKKGFECKDTCSPETQIAINTIPNTFYDWDIEGHSTNVMSGTIPLGKSTTFNFSFDDNGKIGNDRESIDDHIHTDPQNISIAFTHAFDATDLSTSNENLATMTWLGSLFNSSSGEEEQIFFRHANTPPTGNKETDCYNAATSDEGKIYCRKEVRLKGTFMDFVVNDTFKGFDDTVPPNTLDVDSDFFSNTNAEFRKLKFFYINSIPGFDTSDPSLDKIEYTINPNGKEITNLISVITSQGRSRNILTNLQVEIDNTQEFGALDYGALLE
jgi:hypothetical protein